MKFFHRNDALSYLTTQLFGEMPMAHDHDDKMHAAIHPEAAPSRDRDTYTYDPTKPITFTFDFEPDREFFGRIIEGQTIKLSRYDLFRGWLHKHETTITWTMNIAALVLAVLALILATGCQRETPIAKDQAPVTTTYTDTMGADPMAAATMTGGYQTVEPIPSLAWRDDTPGAFALDAMIEREQPHARKVTLLGQQPAETRAVHFATPAVPLRVFRVDNHAPLTVDNVTYRRPQFAFVAIDIADAMRSEDGCLYADWLTELSRGTCFWPRQFGRGPWMVVPIDTSAVVQFRRRAGANILSPIRIAELPTISAAELK